MKAVFQILVLFFVRGGLRNVKKIKRQHIARIWGEKKTLADPLDRVDLVYVLFLWCKNFNPKFEKLRRAWSVTCGDGTLAGPARIAMQKVCPRVRERSVDTSHS